MDTSVLLALLAASVTLLGWLINYILTGRDERRRKQLEESLARMESQLQELYGPLAFAIQEGQRTHQDLLKALGRDHVFVEGKELTEDELKTWLFWVENDLFPRNERIKTLLLDKTHLIDDEQVPQSYLDFLEHYNSWKINHLRWQKEQVKYPWRSNLAFPDQFAAQVLATFEALKSRHARALGLKHASANTRIKKAENKIKSIAGEK